MPESTHRGIEAGVLVAANSLYNSPMWNTDKGLGQEPVSASQQCLLEHWTKEFPFEGHSVPCYWTLLTEVTPMIEGRKMILEPEIAITARMMSEKHTNGDGSIQKSNKMK